MILLLEDDEDYADIIAHTLRRDGHDVVITGTVASAVQLAKRKTPTAAILDVSLPDGTGLEACKLLRGISPGLPVLFLSALDRAEDIISGLEVGGDDYITKPFHPTELLARVRAVMRRGTTDLAPASKPSAQAISSHGLEVDLQVQRATFEGKSLNLTPLEVEILWQLMRYPGQALSHAFLTEQIWGYNNVSDATLLKGHVSSLRRKLREAEGPERMVRTVHGVGYSFTPL